MNKIVLVLVLVLFYAYSFGQIQDERGVFLRNLFWNNSTEEWNQTDVPSKWANESAVVLAKQTTYRVKKFAVVSVLEENYHTHKRIKVLDDNAVSSYSEFSFGDTENRGFNGIFTSNSVFYYYGIKLIKPDGREMIIDHSKEIREEVSHRRSRVGYNKIAIPNLEKGDIIDFYYCVEREFSMNMFYVFDPMRYFINEQYPIMHQELVVEIARKCFLNCKSINGAPDLVEDKEDNSKKVYTYRMCSKDQEKLELPAWSYPYAELPCIKFQAFNSGPGLSTRPYYADFLGKLQKLKSEVNKDGLIGLSKALNNAGRGGFYNQLNKYIKAKYGKNTKVQPRDIVYDAYFFLREFWTQQPLFLKSQNGGTWHNFNMHQLVAAISRLLKNYEIEHDILFMVPKYLSKESDLLFIDELHVGLRILSSDKPIYITSLGLNSLPDVIPDYFKGVKAYGVSMLKPLPVVKELQLPMDTATKSDINVCSTLTLDVENAKVKLVSDFSISGLAKLQWDSVIINRAVFHSEFKHVEYGKYIHDKGIRKNLKAYREFQSKLSIGLEEANKKRMDKLENQLKYFFGIAEPKVTSFDLLSSGRWTEKDNLEFRLSWEIHEPYIQAGDYVLFNVGQFSKKGDNISDMPESRTFDIHFDSGNSFSHKLKLLIPEGMQLEGLGNAEVCYQDDVFRLDCQVDTSSYCPSVSYKQQILSTHLNKSKWDNVKLFFSKCKEMNEQQVLVKSLNE